jgi:hypothetical protein
LLLTPLEVRPYSHFVTEWEPSSLSEVPMAVTVGMAGVVAISWARRTEKVSMPHIAIWVIGVAWALLYGRTVAVGAVMLAPLFAITIARLLSSRQHADPSAKRESVVVGLGAIAALVLATLLAPQVATAPGNRLPIGLGTGLDALAPGTVVINEYSLGGWLLWSHPDLSPVIDGRTEVFSISHIGDYGDAVLAHAGWQEFVMRTRSSAAVLPVGGPLTGDLEQQLGWREVARDRGYVLLKAPSE